MQVIDAAKIRSFIGIQDLYVPIKSAFPSSDDQVQSGAAISILNFPDGDAHIKSAYMGDLPIYTVKIVNSIATANGPVSGGMIAVFSRTTGSPICVLRDEGYLTDIRTAATGAMASDLFAPRTANVLGVVGTGLQARLQTEALMGLRPLKKIIIWGREPEKARALVAELQAKYPSPAFFVSVSIKDLMNEAEIVITTTSSQTALIEEHHLREGQHITAVGADDIHKVELSPGALKRGGRVFIDSLVANQSYGDVHNALKNGLNPAGLFLLGDVLKGKIPGRRSTSEITICKLVGIGLQDLVTSQVLIKKLGIMSSIAPNGR